jgi:hypothetical protein
MAVVYFQTTTTTLNSRHECELCDVSNEMISVPSRSFELGSKATRDQLIGAARCRIDTRLDTS